MDHNPPAAAPGRRIALVAAAAFALAMLPAAAAEHTEELHCPTVEAQATADGILLTWTSDDDRTEEYRIYREPAEGFGEEPVPGILVDGNTTSYHDTTAMAGVTYTYEVSPGGFKLFSPNVCPSVSATLRDTSEIPFFPSPLALALGAMGVLAAAGMVLSRRR